ncbi:hypothetical protein ACHAXT_000036 [Thalassiosira profunda]
MTSDSASSRNGDGFRENGGRSAVTFSTAESSAANQDGGVHAHVAIEIPQSNDAGDVNAPKCPTLDKTHTVSLRIVQLVELSLEHITYAPLTRSAATGRCNCFKSSVSKKRTAILSDVTTTIEPHSLNGWMGPSGSGKTSLLSVAAGLISDPANDLAGDSCIRINGERGTLPKSLVGVVWQDDLLLSNLTVRETVRFAARLKTPKDRSDAEVEVLVNDTLSKLGLVDVQDRLIGVPGGSGRSRGISGGERKRVAVAVELVARPSILLLDEPTSGLDATTAYQLMLTLKSLARMGHSIVVVIHQPRTSIFDMLDNLLLLSRGKVVYEGEPSGAREFLEGCGVGELPPETGKADWIMDIIIEDERRDDGGKLHSQWEEFNSTQQRSAVSSRVEGGLRHRHSSASQPPQNASKRPRRLSSMAELKESEPKFQSSFWTQLKLLTVRASRQHRGQRLTLVALVQSFAFTAFVCLAWGRLPNTTTYNFSRASLLFFLIIAQSNSVVMSSLVIFSSERRLLMRDRAKKMYGVLPYFIAMTLSDMTNSVLLPSLNGIICYWVCGLRPTADAFFVFVLVLYLSISAAQSTGLFLSVLIPNTQVALILTPLLTICLMIIGGFYMPYDLISPALRWASWLSFCRYGFSAFLITEFGDRYIPCDEPDDALQCPMPGSEVIASYGIEGVWTGLWPNVALLVAIQIFLRGSTYILLRRSK